jgi:hypothetical protein
MQRRKPSAADPALKRAAGSASGALTKAPLWKKATLVILGLLIALGALYAAGTFDNIRLGPKIPIDRVSTEFPLGMTLEELSARYKKSLKNLRPFNGDKDLRIITLTAKDGYKTSDSADLLFHKDKLYFVSVMWSGPTAESQPFEMWVKNARRWKLNKGGTPENLGAEVLLKEWHFADGPTEMTLRDLKFNDSRQRWRELRDASNEPAQTAFAKYRLEAGG